MTEIDVKNSMTETDTWGNMTKTYFRSNMTEIDVSSTTETDVKSSIDLY